jgi:signal transduction histidine kinase
MSTGKAWPGGPEKFHLLRYFSVLSFLVLAVMTAGFVVLYREHAVGRLLASEERQNVATTRLFANSIYPRFTKHLKARAGRTAAALRASPKTAELDRAVRAMMRGLHVLKVKIYDLDGVTVYSSDPSQIGEDKRGNRGFLTARRGGVASELTHRGKFSAFEGEIQDRNVIASYVPIRNGGGPVLGVIEVYADVTPFLARIESLQVRLTAIVGAAFLLLYLVLFLIVKRADLLIRRQAEAIFAKRSIELQNRKLESEIAERKRVQDSLAKAREMAELANRAKSQFLANMSHELRTPLNAIIGFADLMSAEVHGPVGHASYRDYVTNIHESGGHLLEIVNDILDLSRIEAGRVDLDESEFDLSELVVECGRLIGGRAEEFGVLLDTRLPDGLPLLRGDRRLVKQILLNLLSNAVKFTKWAAPSPFRRRFRAKAGSCFR